MSEVQTNAVDPVVARRWIGEIDRAKEELLSERGAYMARCKAIRERIKEYKESAANAGIPRAGLNHLLKVRDIEAKLAALNDDAEPEIVETADMIREALGDYASLPLGAAAVDAAEGDDEDLRGNRQREREEQRQADAAANLAGMKEPKKRGRKPKAGGAALVGEDAGADALASLTSELPN